MKKILLPVALLLTTPLLYAQHYYNDILGTKKTNDLWKLYKQNAINSMATKSTESDGQPSEGFLLEQKINLQNKTIETTTGSAATGKSLLTSYFNEKDQLVKTVDKNDNSENSAVYTYDNDGRLLSIETNSITEDTSFSLSEKHLWFYNSTGQAEKMLKIKNDNDTATIRINYDEKGNAGEEVDFAKGKQLERYYFYYNAKKQLTDIVRYNIRYKRMLPDYSFDYDDAGRLNEMTVYRVQSSGSDYLTWMYLYDAKGLKLKEACVDRDRKLVGKIEYSYNGQ
jgi:phosphoribosyl-AMP cyclohydrolase